MGLFTLKSRSAVVVPANTRVGLQRPLGGHDLGHGLFEVANFFGELPGPVGDGLLQRIEVFSVLVGQIPFFRGMGLRILHTVPVDQADGLPFRRNHVGYSHTIPESN